MDTGEQPLKLRRQAARVQSTGQQAQAVKGRGVLWPFDEVPDFTGLGKANLAIVHTPDPFGQLRDVAELLLGLQHDRDRLAGSEIERVGQTPVPPFQELLQGLGQLPVGLPFRPEL